MKIFHIFLKKELLNQKYKQEVKIFRGKKNIFKTSGKNVIVKYKQTPTVNVHNFF